MFPFPARVSERTRDKNECLNVAALAEWRQSILGLEQKNTNSFTTPHPPSNHTHTDRNANVTPEVGLRTGTRATTPRG